MTYLFETHTVSTPRLRPQMPVNPFRKPALSFAEQAALDNEAVRKTWDARIQADYASRAEDLAARRAAWLAMLPPSVFGRPEARAAMGVGPETADSRLDKLEQIGLRKRVAGRPIKWEKT